MTTVSTEITNLQKPINLYAVYNVKKFVLKAYAATNGDPGTTGNATGGTVKFDSQTSSGAYATITVDYTGTATFVAIVKETDGYKFSGWYSDPACSSSKLVTNKLTYTADKNTEYKTLYAKFELKKYNASAVAVTNGTESNATGGTVQVTADGVINIDCKEYEVDYCYQNQRITIRYSPDLSKVYVVDKFDNSLKEIKLLDKKANSNIKRTKVKLAED